VYVFYCVCSGLATGRSPLQGVLPTIRKVRNYEWEEARELNPSKKKKEKEKEKNEEEKQRRRRRRRRRTPSEAADYIASNGGTKEWFANNYLERMWTLGFIIRNTALGFRWRNSGYSPKSSVRIVKVLAGIRTEHLLTC
jgi:hypothetical protein